MKKNAVFSLFSILYFVFLAKADMYSMPEMQKKSEVSCCIIESENICCGKETQEGNCQQTNCCHVSTSTSTFSVHHNEENIETSAQEVSDIFLKKLEPLKDFYIDTYQSLISEYEAYFRNAYTILLSYFQVIQAFFGIWRN